MSVSFQNELRRSTELKKRVNLATEGIRIEFGFVSQELLTMIFEKIESRIVFPVGTKV